MKKLCTAKSRHMIRICRRPYRWRRPLLFLLCFQVSLAGARAQHLAEPQFVQTLTNNSITDGVVYALAQDAQGYLWAGGATGVARYDAYQFVRFPLREHPGDAEVTSFVSTITAGRDGRLWLGLPSVGMAALDPRTGLSVFYRHDPKNPQSLAQGSIGAIVADGADGFWIGTHGGGLDHFDPSTGRFSHMRAADGGPPNDNIAALLLDRRGDLWVGSEQGLVRKARGTGRFLPALRDPRDQERLARLVVSRLREDRAGRLWVGTLSGELLIVDPASGQVKWLPDGEAAPGSAVNAIEETDDNQMWIGRTNGIEIRATDSGAVRQRLRHIARRIGALAAPVVPGIVRDRSGVMFVATYGGGVQRYVPPLPGISVVRPALDDPSDGIATRSIVEMRNGDIWLGRGEFGISVLDQALRRTGGMPLPAQPARGSAPDEQVISLAQGRDGHVWAGSATGVYEFDEGRRFMRRFDVAGGARRLLADRDGVLWIGTPNGVLRKAADAVAPAPVMLASGGPMRSLVNALEQDPAGRVWAGTITGVFGIDGADGAAHKLQATPAPADGHYAVKGMLADADGLWIDSDGGRYRVDRMRGDTARYALAIDGKGADGHPIGANLLRDRAGRLWTQRGVHDPASGAYDEFSLADGVDIGTGWFRSYAQLRDGRMLFGGSSGLLVVAPDQYTAWSYRPPVLLTALSVGARRMALPASGGITVAPPQRSFRAEFTALDYSAPERNRYRYRLRGYDPDWRETAANLRVASYDNLPPGQYTLQVQGSNRNGLWSDVQASLAVTVLPAWWETWWARLAMLALAGASMMGVVQWRTLRLRRRKDELESHIAERTAELRNMAAALAAKSEALEMASLTDPLTGLHNRRFLAERIDADVALSVRHHEELQRHPEAPGEEPDLIFFLIDIDHFKRVNDQYGHGGGDAVLSQIRHRLRGIFRESDHVIRWGGEEFLVVARATRRDRAAELAERARAAVADQPFVLPDGRLLTNTCSVGYACFPPARQFPRALDWQAVMEIADASLYLVKKGGRNGWYGVTEVTPQDLEDLRDLIRRPLAEWEGTERATIQRSW